MFWKCCFIERTRISLYWRRSGGIERGCCCPPLLYLLANIGNIKAVEVACNIAPGNPKDPSLSLSHLHALQPLAYLLAAFYHQNSSAFITCWPSWQEKYIPHSRELERKKKKRTESILFSFYDIEKNNVWIEKHTWKNVKFESLMRNDEDYKICKKKLWHTLYEKINKHRIDIRKTWYKI